LLIFLFIYPVVELPHVSIAVSFNFPVFQLRCLAIALSFNCAVFQLPRPSGRVIINKKPGFSPKYNWAKAQKENIYFIPGLKARAIQPGQFNPGNSIRAIQSGQFNQGNSARVTLPGKFNYQLNVLFLLDALHEK
jgi:hypothetical protein